MEGVAEVAEVAAGAGGPTTVYIGVVGGARCDEGLALKAAAVGREVAARGGVVVCGGRGGVMEAAARGAAGAGGVVLGILPDPHREGANEYLTYSIPTGLGQARNVIIVLASHALIAIGGEYGTLSEVATALKLGTPVVGLDTWALTPPAGAPSQPAVTGAIRRATTPAQAVELAWQAALSRAAR